MTQKEMIETVQAQFPQVGEKRLRKMLNNANDRFVESTRIVQDVAYTSSVANQLYYFFSDFNNSNGGELFQINRLNVEDYEDDRRLIWWVEDNQRIGIGIEQYLGGEANSLKKGGLTIQVNGVFSDPGYGSDLTDEPAYDSSFHMGIVYKVIDELHSEKGNMDMAKHFYQKYRDVEIAAKKHAGSNGIKGQYEQNYN